MTNRIGNPTGNNIDGDVGYHTYDLDIHSLNLNEKLQYISELLCARMKFEGKPKSHEEAHERIRKEIEESGWNNVKVEDVWNYILGINSLMLDFGPDRYMNEIRKSLNAVFGVKFPENYA